MKRHISTLLLVLLCLTPVAARYWIQETYGAECGDSCSDPVQLARMSGPMLGASSGAAVQTDSCPGSTGMRLSWHCENLDVTLGGIAGGVNNGCSVAGADSVFSKASGAVIDVDGSPVTPIDGIGTCSAPTTSDYFELAWESSDIVNPDQGTVDFYVYITTWASGYSLLYVPSVDASNSIYINNGGGYLKIYHKSGVLARFATSTLAWEADTWYHVIAKWSKDKSGDSTNYLSICMDTTTGTTNCGYYTAGVLGDWAGTSGVITVGASVNTGANVTFDNIKIYGSWQ